MKNVILLVMVAMATLISCNCKSSNNTVAANEATEVNCHGYWQFTDSCEAVGMNGNQADVAWAAYCFAAHENAAMNKVYGDFVDFRNDNLAEGLSEEEVISEWAEACDEIEFSNHNDNM